MNVLTQSPLIWEAFFLVFCRVGTLLMIAPVFGNRSVPAQVRLAFALMLTLIMLPIATTGKFAVTQLPSSWLVFLGLVAQEVLIGAIVGFSVMLIFTALQSAGHIVGLQIGFSLANVINPLTADHASLIDQFYTLLAMLVFLAINGHHALLLAAQQTFDLVPLGSQNVGLPAGPLLMAWGTQLFVVALRISMPLMAALLLADLALAIVARGVPQLNVFVVGMPAKLIVGFAMLAITVPVTAMLIARLFEDVGNSTAVLLRSMVP